MSDEEEMVACSLGNDYYLGAYFMTREANSSAATDYLVPRSQLERWEAAKAAYEDMQFEIDQVMDEQRERIRALRADRPKSQLAQVIEQIYAQQMGFALSVPPSLRGPNYKESDDTPWLVTDAKIDRDEEERGL